MFHAHICAIFNGLTKASGCTGTLFPTQVRLLSERARAVGGKRPSTSTRELNVVKSEKAQPHPEQHGQREARDGLDDDNHHNPPTWLNVAYVRHLTLTLSTSSYGCWLIPRCQMKFLPLMSPLGDFATIVRTLSFDGPAPPEAAPPAPASST